MSLIKSIKDSSPSPKSILVVRNDKLGDFILCLPSLYLLRKSHPNAKITMLVSSITYDLAKSLPHLIDDLILDVGKKASKKEQIKMTNQIRKIKANVSISLFSSFHIARALYKAGIANRFAPKTKLAQVFYNHKITQRRSQSIQSEFSYNLELIYFFLTYYPSKKKEKIELRSPYLKFDQDEVQSLKTNFLKQHQINPNTKLVFMHPGDSGSAANLSIGQYTNLANALIGNHHFLVLSAGPYELELVQKLAKGLNKKNYVILTEPNIVQYAKHLQFADLLICGSTGPLHIAGALNRNTCAFFPRDPATSMLRWQPINDAEKQLFFSPDENKDSTDMASIEMNSVALKVSKLFLMI